MNVFYAKRFEKHFQLLSKKIQEQFFERIEIFTKNPSHPTLKNHALKGVLSGSRAFSVTGDYRVIFRYLNKTDVKLLDIGTHNQVY